MTHTPHARGTRARILLAPAIALVLGGLAAMPANAAVDLSALDMRVAIFAGAVPGAEGGARSEIDRRLKLADCASDPKLEWRTERRDAVVVSCQGPNAWRIFVPVIRTSAPAAAAPAAPGAVMTAPRIAAAPVAAETIIRRGDAVTVQVSSGGFTVSRDGVALSDAAAGGRVRIKVDDRPNPVQAVAVQPGLATIPQGIS